MAEELENAPWAAKTAELVSKTPELPDAPWATAPAPVGGFNERQRAYREALQAGRTGNSAAEPTPQPELQHTGAELAGKWGQFGKGLAKGVPAGLSGGFLGDIEELGRHGINKLAEGEVVSPHTAIPTSTEGGYLGPRGAGILAKAANEDEALGIGLTSQILPGKIVGKGLGVLNNAYKDARFARRYGEVEPPDRTAGPRPEATDATVVEDIWGNPAGTPLRDYPAYPKAIEHNTAPAPVPVPRNIRGANVSLLPPETSHIPQQGPALSSVGAEGRALAESYHPEALNMVRQSLKQEGLTLEQFTHLSENEMSPQQFLLEVGDTPYRYARGIAADAGQGSVDIKSSFRQRGAEAPERINAISDRYLGETSNIFDEKRLITEDQKRASSSAYSAFRSTRIPMTPELEVLMEPLAEAGAFQKAERLNKLTPGASPLDMKQPTAQTWDLVKRSLDSKVGTLLREGDNVEASKIIDLKHRLVNAIDNHPDANVRGVWATAREAYAGPARIKDAMDLGRRLLTDKVDPHEFAYMVSTDLNPEEIQGILVGLRSHVRHELGGVARKELKTLNELVSQNSQIKLQSLLGDEMATDFARELQFEIDMHHSPRNIINTSQTTPIAADRELWKPKASLMERGKNAYRAIRHPLETGMEEVSKRMSGAAELEAEQIRNDAARLYTMQGPQRTAVGRYLLEEDPARITVHPAPGRGIPRAKGGRVIKRADGGRATRKNFEDGGAPDIDPAAEAEAARNSAARRITRSVLRDDADFEEARPTPEVIKNIGSDYSEGVANQRTGAAAMGNQGIDNMRSGNPAKMALGVGQSALSPVLGMTAPLGGAMNTVTKGFGRVGPGMEHAAEVATLLNPDTPLLKAAPMLAGAMPIAKTSKAAAKSAVVDTAAKLGKPAETLDDVGAGLQDVTKPVREMGNEGPLLERNEAAAAAQESPGASVRGPAGAGSLESAQEAAARAAAGTRPLEALPDKPLKIATPGGEITYVPGPITRVHELANEYMREAGLKYQPLTSYREVSVPRAKRLAEAYEKMPHAPNDPAVKASYDAMINETVAQLKTLQKSGLEIEFIKPGMKDPYEASPRMAQIDVRDNNHLWVFPTDAGFGSSGAATAAELANNPLLRKTGITIGDRELLANDAFRIVHDFFGHIKDGVGFRAGGEENAWRSHSRMYSKLARPAMTSETRGQNSWLNYGPHGEKNRTAKSADTIYADQKTGIMPSWAHTEGLQDYYAAPKTEAGARIVNAGVDAPTNKSAQTVADPHRMMYPGIYGNPRVIAQEAAARVAPEDIDMKRLWGVSRGDLDEMAKGRKGNRDPGVYQGPGVARGALSAQNIQTPQNTQRLQDILAEAGKHPGLRHADAWYTLDPVYQRMVQLFGPEEAKARFERFNALMAMASPGSEVMREIQRGTAANMKAEQGKFDEFLKYAGTPREFRKGPADLSRVEAHPYHRTSQAEPMQKYLDTGKIQSKEAKVVAYAGASGVPETGFQTRGPVGDSHFSRGTGMADTRRGPTDVGSSVSRSEYHTLQPWWENEVAGELGLESVAAQARLWTALGPRTGVTSALGQGKLELLTKQIMKAAKRLGISPEKARDLILSGKEHAGMLAATAAAGAVASGGDERRASGGSVKKKAKAAVVETAQQIAAKGAIRRAIHGS